jgi:hypothetical protein
VSVSAPLACADSASKIFYYVDDDRESVDVIAAGQSPRPRKL